MHIQRCVDLVWLLQPRAHQCAGASLILASIIARISWLTGRGQQSDFLSNAQIMSSVTRYWPELASRSSFARILTPPSSKMGPIRPFLVSRAYGRYSAIRLCARHVRSADTSRRENASSARVCGQRPSRSEATRMRASVIAWFEPAIYESDC